MYGSGVFSSVFADRSGALWTKVAEHAAVPAGIAGRALPVLERPRCLAGLGGSDRHWYGADSGIARRRSSAITGDPDGNVSAVAGRARSSLPE